MVQSDLKPDEWVMIEGLLYVKRQARLQADTQEKSDCLCDFVRGEKRLPMANVAEEFPLMEDGMWSLRLKAPYHRRHSREFTARIGARRQYAHYQGWASQIRARS